MRTVHLSITRKTIVVFVLIFSVVVYLVLVQEWVKFQPLVVPKLNLEVNFLDFLLRKHLSKNKIRSRPTFNLQNELSKPDR